MKPRTVTRLLSITDSYPSKIAAFALYNACSQLISVSPRYDHLRNNIEENAAKLAEDLLVESDKFFTIKEEMAKEAQLEKQNEADKEEPIEKDSQES